MCVCVRERERERENLPNTPGATNAIVTPLYVQTILDPKDTQHKRNHRRKRRKKSKENAKKIAGKSRRVHTRVSITRTQFLGLRIDDLKRRFQRKRRKSFSGIVIAQRDKVRSVLLIFRLVRVLAFIVTIVMFSYAYTLPTVIALCFFHS